MALAQLFTSAKPLKQRLDIRLLFPMAAASESLLSAMRLSLKFPLLLLALSLAFLTSATNGFLIQCFQ